MVHPESDTEIRAVTITLNTSVKPRVRLIPHLSDFHVADRRARCSRGRLPLRIWFPAPGSVDRRHGSREWYESLVVSCRRIPVKVVMEISSN